MLLSQHEGAGSTLNPKTASELNLALQNLPTPAPHLGEYPIVLRIVASFPNTPSFHNFEKPQRKEKDSPIAVLNTTLFEEVTAKIRASDVVDGVMASFLGRRPQNPEDIKSETISAEHPRLDDPPSTDEKLKEVANKPESSVPALENSLAQEVAADITSSGDVRDSFPGKRAASPEDGSGTESAKRPRTED